jgi:hypothetical protein
MFVGFVRFVARFLAFGQGYVSHPFARLS